MHMSKRQILGIAFVAAGLAAGGLALRSWQTHTDPVQIDANLGDLVQGDRASIAVGPGQPQADRSRSGQASQSPDLSSATIAVAEDDSGFRVPTAEEMARARDAIAAELELLSPGPVGQIPTTSGVGYTLGMRGASVALYWPRPDGETEMGVRCHDVPAPRMDADQEGL